MLQAQPSYHQPPLSRRLDKSERQRLAIQSHLARQSTEQHERFDAALEAILTSPLEGTSRFILITIAHMNRINRYKVSYERISKRTGYSHRTICRHLVLMEQQGVLEITRSARHGPNRYAIMIPQPHSA